MGHRYKKETREKKLRQQEAKLQKKPAHTSDGKLSISADTAPPPPPPLDLLRGKQALNDIQSMIGNDYGKYVSYVQALPAAILQNGLGQAMATLLAGAKLGKTDESKRSADEKARERLFSQLQTWMCRDDVSAPYRNQKNLMQAITGQNEDAYIRAQAEALAYLRWLKKFSVAFLDKQEKLDAPVV